MKRQLDVKPEVEKKAHLSPRDYRGDGPEDRGEDSPEEKTVPKKRRTIVKRTAVPKKRTTGPE